MTQSVTLIEHNENTTHQITKDSETLKQQQLMAWDILVDFSSIIPPQVLKGRQYLWITTFQKILTVFFLSFKLLL